MAKAVAKQVAVDDWQAEDDMRTLARAEEIKRDKARMKRAQDCAKKKLADMVQVAGMKADAS